MIPNEWVIHIFLEKHEGPLHSRNRLDACSVHWFSLLFRKDQTFPEMWVSEEKPWFQIWNFVWNLKPLLFLFCWLPICHPCYPFPPLNSYFPTGWGLWLKLESWMAAHIGIGQWVKVCGIAQKLKCLHLM